MLCYDAAAPLRCRAITSHIQGQCGNTVQPADCRKNRMSVCKRKEQMAIYSLV